MADPSKQSTQNQVEQAKHKRRMREDWDNLIDDLIQEGLDQGLFDNLPGKGKPLDLSRNHFESGRELAHELLKENDIPPSWIMERNLLLEERDALREEIKRKWRWHQASFESEPERRSKLTISWDDACLAWHEQIQHLNKRIDTYNLKRPSENLELFKLILEDELKRAGAVRWLR